TTRDHPTNLPAVERIPQATSDIPPLRHARFLPAAMPPATHSPATIGRKTVPAASVRRVGRSLQSQAKSSRKLFFRRNVNPVVGTMDPAPPGSDWRGLLLENFAAMVMTLVILALCIALPVLGVAHLAEQRRRARGERQAIESERRFRQLAESSFDMSVRVHPATQRRTSASPASRRLSGYEPEQA